MIHLINLIQQNEAIYSPTHVIVVRWELSSPVEIIRQIKYI